MSIENRPCEKRVDYHYAYEYRIFAALPDEVLIMDNSYDAAFDNVEEVAVEEAPEPKKPTVDIRTYFPETWLWDLHFVGDSGALTLHEELPHTVTEWVGTGFCSHVSSGLGVSLPTAIKGFQPFFVSLTLPYSLVRGETLKLPVTVFNYLTDCLVVSLTLASSDDYDIIGPSNVNPCVCGQESVTHYYKLTAKSLGEIDITIHAVSIDNNGACGNEVFMSDQIGVRDAVTRKLLIEGEGREDEYTHTAFMCPSTDEQIVRETMSLELPNDFVMGTQRAFISVIGDIMGPSLSGLDNLLRQPTGCGEQTMLTFTPNIYVLQYLTSTNQLTTEIQDKALRHMRTGYQRELGYRHNDGSYSAFGKSDDSGSTWLTAFVVKSFAEAKEYITIDDKDLEKSVKWFLSKQQENGCFPKIGRVLHKDMQGGIGGGSSDASLTAFVLISLLESQSHVSVPGIDSAIESGFSCLTRQSVSDMYSMSLIAYAHSLKGGQMNEEKRRMSRMIEDRAIENEGKMHWSNTAVEPNGGEDGWSVTHINKPKSADVEMTSYILMSMIESQGPEAIGRGLPVVKWLTAQRNAYGGFSSTQDTVLALQALASYATMAYTDGGQLAVNINANGDRQRLSVNDDNKLVLQQLQVPLPNSVNVEVSGTGCVLVQAIVKYNVANISTVQPAFNLKSTIQKQDTCKVRKLNVCATYEGTDGASNMAVITVKMVSGWIPVKDSVNRLRNDAALGLKRHEIQMNLVNFYFDELTGTETCLSFKVEQDIEVEHAKPGYVKVYDYYKNELSVTKPYEIKQICGTKEELPEISWAEFDRKNEDWDNIEQVRVPSGTRPPRRDIIGAIEQPEVDGCRNGGTFENGRCSCAWGYFGPSCECDRDFDERQCMREGSSEICEGHGSCVCGQCACNQVSISDPAKRYTGQFCECSDYGCDHYENMLCGGPSRGRCFCGSCMCMPDYTGNACECTLNQETCITPANGKVCNGHGRCQCGRCLCEYPYKGVTCQKSVQQGNGDQVPVDEPLIIPEHVEPLGSEVCPLCLETEPEDFLEKFCAADKAYKVIVRGNNRFPVKLLHDLRLKNKPNIGKIATLNMPGSCTCSMLRRQFKNRKALILTTGTEYTPAPGGKVNLVLNGQSMVLLYPTSNPQSQNFERSMRQKVKHNRCA